MLRLPFFKKKTHICDPRRYVLWQPQPGRLAWRCPVCNTPADWVGRKPR